MIAETKRWGWDSKGKGWNRNLTFPWSSLWLLSDEAESNIKKKNIRKNLRLSKIQNKKSNIPIIHKISLT
jgi:hypothetical protein